MNTLNMLLKATLVITLFTALPHITARWSNEDGSAEINYFNESGQWEMVAETKQPPMVQEESTSTQTLQSDKHPLEGYWYTTYDELEVAVTYEFRKSDDVLSAYSVEIYDKNGDKVNDNTLCMNVASFANGKGTAKYFMEYEGKRYEVQSLLELKNDRLVVSYSFEGYAGEEVWEKVKM